MPAGYPVGTADTATAEAAQFVLDTYSGDLRKFYTLVGPDDYARFASALVRVALDEDLAGTLTA